MNRHARVLSLLPLPGKPGRGSSLVALIGLLVMLAGCRKSDMADQPRYDPMEPSGLFADGKSARPLVNGTVPRGLGVVNDPIYAVTAPGPEATRFPFPLTPQDLVRGQQQYTIYCSVCHGRLGDGNGMIVQRGFPHPPSLYLPRLRNAPAGHFYNVIAHGYGAMYSYNDRVSPDDRWRITGYIRALQLGDPNNNGMATTSPAKSK